MCVDLGNLWAFLVLSEELHYGRAARRLFVSQPALSKQIRRLESDLGGALFERTSSKVALTAVGGALQKQTRQLLTENDAWAAYAKKVIDGKLGDLRLGFIVSLAYDLLPLSIRCYREQFPGATVSLDLLSSGQIRAKLLDGSLDAGFLEMPLQDERLEGREIATESRCLAVPADWETSVFSSEMDEPQHLVVFLQGSCPEMQQRAVEICHRAGLYPKSVQVVGDLFSALSLVRGGYGPALVPCVAQRIQIAGISFRPLEHPDTESKLAIAWRRDRRSHVQEFLRLAMMAEDTLENARQMS